MTLEFLQRDGDTAALMRAHGWADSALGDPGGWPQPLQTLVATILAAGEPMFVAWGNNHLMLYNDAYAELMGPRHPALGRGFADIWPELVDVVGPMLAQAYAGTPGRMDRISLVRDPRDNPEEAHFTLSLTPVRDDDSGDGGIFCVCNEITGRIRAQHAATAEIERFRQLFEQSPGVIAVLQGPEHRIELTSPGFRHLAGTREVIDLRLGEAMPDFVEHGCIDLVDTVYRTGEPSTARAVRVMTSAAEAAPPVEHFMDVACQPIRDAGGAVSAVFMECFDVSDACRLRDALREREEQLRFTVESASDYAILTTDNIGTITSWSKGAEAAFQWTREEILGHSSFRLFVPSDQADEAPARELATAARDGLASDERWHQRKDGSLVFMNGSVRPLHDAAGGQLGFIKMARDETERRRQNDALHKSLALRAALIELGDRLRNLDDMDAIAFAAAELCGQTLSVSRCGYGVVDPVRQIITIERDFWSAPGAGSVAGVWPFERFAGYLDVLARGETVTVTDTETDARTQGRSILEATDAAFDAGRTMSFIKLPIVEHGHFVALFYLNHSAPRVWSTEEIGFARAAADRVWAASERVRAEQRLRTLNATLELEIQERTQERDQIWNISQDLMAVLGPDGVLRAANPAWERVLGFSPAQVVGRHISDLRHPEDRPADQAAQAQYGQRGHDPGGQDRGGQGGPVAAEHQMHASGVVPVAFEHCYRHKEGGFRWLSWTAATAENGLTYVNGRDITEEKAAKDALAAAEDALRQSQKMEAVGQLTGGIAHDFNNILTGIMGSLDIMRRRIESGRTEGIGRFMDAAYGSAQRAASLTHRLLAFARRQSLDAKPSDVNQLVAGMEELLHRTLGEQVGLQTALSDDLWPAMTDPHQLEGAILNLAINARDAMPDGGLLTIGTLNERLDATFVAPFGELAPGDYVVISVSDSGVGMSADVAERAFDPFFTTKPIGQGTGLGLSMVYGFAKQSRGHVRIQTTLGLGSTFRLYLPRSRTASGASLPADANSPPLGGGETVLVVEDDATVRLLITDVLDELGYRHLEATSGAPAITIIQSPRRIDLMISDVGLPGMNGRQLAEVARQMRPGLKVLFVTGYAEIAASRGGFLEPGMDMLIKPFALETLATKVRSMIHA